jgi:hypothetical protein
MGDKIGLEAGKMMVLSIPQSFSKAYGKKTS